MNSTLGLFFFVLNESIPGIPFVYPAGQKPKTLQQKKKKLRHCFFVQVFHDILGTFRLVNVV